jgi:hypothetical protein
MRARLVRLMRSERRALRVNDLLSNDRAPDQTEAAALLGLAAIPVAVSVFMIMRRHGCACLLW